MQAQYRVTALSAIEGVRTAAEELTSAPTSSAVLASLSARLHRLRGTAGSYGLAEVSRLAAESEERVARWISDPALEPDERAAAISRLACALEVAVMKR